MPGGRTLYVGPYVKYCWYVRGMSCLRGIVYVSPIPPGEYVVYSSVVVYVHIIRADTEGLNRNGYLLLVFSLRGVAWICLGVVSIVDGLDGLDGMDGRRDGDKFMSGEEMLWRIECFLWREERVESE